MYDTKMEFPKGWGFQFKNLPWYMQVYGYFLEKGNLSEDNLKTFSGFSGIFNTKSLIQYYLY